MPIAFITGLNGFTGSYLAMELEEAGYEVYGTSHQPNNISKKNFYLDLCNKEAVKEIVDYVKPQVVVHLAAVSSVTHLNIHELYNTNVLGTRNLLEALSNIKKVPKAILIASSANIYGNTSSKLIDENTTLSPINDYAVSKLSMEYLVRLWMEKLPIIIVRPFNYTGVGQSLNFLLPKIVDHYLKNLKEIELGNIKISRDFSDVRTVVKYYHRLLNADISGQIVNICSGVAYSLEEILLLMEKISGYKIKVKINPNLIRDNEVKILQGSNAKLYNLIGKVSEIPLEETLRWMYFKK